MSAEIHRHIESLGGAIALGEATETERTEYREHIAQCRACLERLGGELELERVAQTVHAARDAEVWEPDLRHVVAGRLRKRSFLLRFALTLAVMLLGVVFTLRLLSALGIARIGPSLAAPLVISAGNARIVVERAAPAPAPKPVMQQQPARLVVTHNVVQIARAAIANIPPQVKPHKLAGPPPEIATVTVHPDSDVAPPRAGQDGVPVWRRGDPGTWRTVSRTTTTSVSETAPQHMTQSVASIHIAAAYTTREAAPVGGETAIAPQPPPIAVQENAQGTTVFEVMVDERGNPTKCVITKATGYPSLDDAVCKAAMKVRYTPKTVDGRPVPGVYRDAFTFHMTPTDQGFPNPIQ